MSIQSGTAADLAKSSNWENIETQQIAFLNRLDPNNAVGNGGVRIDQAWTVQPTGGLDRKQVAELVRMERQVVVYVDAVDSSIQSCYVGAELSTSPVPQIGDEALTTSESLRGDVDTYAVQVEAKDDESADLIDYGHSTLMGVPIDSTNGTGAGGVVTPYQTEVTYRSSPWTSGPELDRHDNLFAHYNVQFDSGATGDSDELRIAEAVTLHWDVFTED